MGVNIADWVRDCIEGPGGMDDFEDHEAVVWDKPERVAAAEWIVRCLANPRNEGSAEVLEKILARRRQVAGERPGVGA